MGARLVERCKGIFAEASEALKLNMSELCIAGHSGTADLKTTLWAQPAIVTCSVASASLHEGNLQVVAGHSLGEYAALISAGALSLTDGLKLVGRRAEAMDAASQVVPGAMAAIMNLDEATVHGLCAGTDAVVAGDNAPGQMVVSGPIDSVEAIIEAAKAAGGRGRRVDVSGAFHSPAMVTAEPALRAALNATNISVPRITFWSSTRAAIIKAPDDIRAALVEQLTKPVLWRQTIARLAREGIDAFLDLGPGKVAANLVRRILPSADVAAIEDSDGRIV